MKRNYLVELLKNNLEAIEYIAEMDDKQINMYFWIATNNQGD